MKETLWQYLRYIGSKIAEFYATKAISATFVGVLCFLFDPLAKDALMALFILIIIDFFTGVAAAKHTGVPIMSSKIRRSAVKLVVYFGMISAAHLTEAAVPEMLRLIDESVTAFLAVTELISIIENTGRLGYAIPRKLLNQLQKYAEKK